MPLVRNKLVLLFMFLLVLGSTQFFLYLNYRRSIKPGTVYNRMIKNARLFAKIYEHGEPRAPLNESIMFSEREESARSRRKLSSLKRLVGGSSFKGLPPVHQRKLVCDRDPHVVALILSNPSNGKLREVIRETWASQGTNESRQLQIVFVTGRLFNMDPIEEKNFIHEMMTNGDVLQGHFLFDSRQNTVSPLLLGINWAEAMCESYRYVYVGFDTTILNYKRLLARLDYCERNKIVDDRSYIGKIFSGKFSSSTNSSLDNVEVPPFCSEGNGYVLTRSATKELADTQEGDTSTLAAGTFLGIFARKKNWTLIQDDMFTSERDALTDACRFQDVVTARGTEYPNQMLSMWKTVNDMNRLLGCYNPDLDVVLPPADNSLFLQEALAYKYSHPHACYDENDKPLDTFMIALIVSHPKDGAVRQSIRETWCKEHVVQGEVIRCVFVLGTPTRDADELGSKVEMEQKKYGDIIQAHFLESYQNLTLKIIFGLKWMTEHFRNAKYFFKGDTDVFVNFNNILAHIQKLRSTGEAKEKFYFGFRMVSSLRISPNSTQNMFQRYVVPDHLYKGLFYPPYCSGGGYVMSTDMVPELYQASLTTSIINIEDAFMGLLARKVGIHPTHDGGFMNYGLFGPRVNTCQLRSQKTMVIHLGINIPEIVKDMWNRYLNDPRRCDNRNPNKYLIYMNQKDIIPPHPVRFRPSG